MPGQALEALRDVEGARHHRILVAKRLQLRLARDRGRERHRRGRILRHELRQLVDLPIGHLQHAPDVAQHAARLQRAEGDDLRDLIAAVALLHVVDHLAAPVLAEVDVEVGHRHAFRIEEALEQQAEADRIEIGDGQRIGDQRAGAGAAARTDRNALGLRPFDEVRNDQEVARIIHAGDDVELEGKPRAIILLGGALRKAVNPRADGRAPPRPGGAIPPPRRSPHPRHWLPAPTVKRGRIGLRVIGRNAQRSAISTVEAKRFRNVGEQHRHLGAGLEAVIGRELLAIGLGDQPAAGDAEQRIMGLVVVRGREIRLVGRDQRQALGIGEIDQPGLDAAFLFDAVALQFDIEAVAEQARQPVAARRRQRRMIGGDRQRNRPVRAAGQRDQILGVALQPFELDVRGLMNRRFQERAGVQPHQAAIAALARRQQHDPRRRRRQRIARVGVLVAEIDRELAADDRLDAVAGHLVGEFQRPEHVVGVGQRQRRLAVGLRQFAELADLDRPLQQRIGRMDVEMDKSGIGRRRRGFDMVWGQQSLGLEGTQGRLEGRTRARQW